MLFLLYRIIYSNNKVGFSIIMAKLTRVVSKYPENMSQEIEEVIIRLSSEKINFLNRGDKEQVVEEYKVMIDEFFTTLFGIEGAVSKGIIKKEMKNVIKNGFMRTLFYHVYNKATSISTTSPFFKIEFSQNIDATIRLLEDIRKIV